MKKAEPIFWFLQLGFWRNFFAFVCVILAIISCDTKKQLDKYGGYYDPISGSYRYEKISRHTVEKELRGIVAPGAKVYQKVTMKASYIVDNLVWLKIENRSIYTLISQNLTNEYKNEKDSMVAVWLEGVSSRAFPFNNLRVKKKFLSQVSNIVQKVIVDKDLVVFFRISPYGIGLRGVVFLPKSTGEKKEESLNYWMIVKGLSPYILPQNEDPPDQLLLNAEKQAKKERAGYWGL